MIWSIAIVMPTKGKSIHVEFRNQSPTFYLRRQSFQQVSSLFMLSKSLEKQSCCRLSSTLFSTGVLPGCVRDTTVRNGSCGGRTESTGETGDTGFAWKHAEVLLVERKSNWCTEERSRMEGGTCGWLPSKCRSKGGGGWAESTGGHVDGQQHQQGFI